MPRGEKSADTEVQKREAEHIRDSYERRGVDPDEAERRAWATVSKSGADGNSSERDKKNTTVSGRAGSGNPAAERSASVRMPTRGRKKRG